MKVILTKETIRIPQEVTITVEHKTVIVTGPYGQEQRSFPSSQLDIQLQGNTVEVSCWQADKKARAMVGTVSAHIRNLINGVAAGYELQLKPVFNHFPIQNDLNSDNRTIRIRNVLGAQRSRTVALIGNTTFSKLRRTDISLLQGTCLEDITQTAASILRESEDDMKRDPVKFLDGIYPDKPVHYQKEAYSPIRKVRAR